MISQSNFDTCIVIEKHNRNGEKGDGERERKNEGSTDREPEKMKNTSY